MSDVVSDCDLDVLALVQHLVLSLRLATETLGADGPVSAKIHLYAVSNNINDENVLLGIDSLVARRVGSLSSVVLIEAFVGTQHAGAAGKVRPRH